MVVKECPCPNKIKYSTKNEARQALHHEWRTGRRKRMPLRVYKCACGGWHTTSKPYRWWNNES